MKYLLLPLLLISTLAMAAPSAQNPNGDNEKNQAVSNDLPCGSPLHIDVKELKKSEILPIDSFTPGVVQPTPGKLPSFLPK